MHLNGEDTITVATGSESGSYCSYLMLKLSATYLVVLVVGCDC